MNKFYSVLIAVSLFATSSFARGVTNNYQYGRIPKTESLSVSGRRVMSDRTTGSPELNSSSIRKATAQTGGLITETPEGNLHKDLYGYAHGYRPFYNIFQETQVDGAVIDVVDSKDGTFYLKNPIITNPSNSWLKGEKLAGTDTIVFKFPQLLDSLSDNNGNPVPAYAQSIHLEIGDGISYYVNKENVIKFTWDGDTLKKIGSEILGLTDADGNWSFYGDDSILVFREKELPTTPPATAVAGRYSLEYDENGQSQNLFVNVKKDGNDLYIGNLYDNNDLWIKGKIEGDKVIFKKQYLGISQTRQSHEYFIPALGDWDENWHYVYTFKNELDYDYDAKTGKFNTDSLFLINMGKNIAQPDKIYDKTAFTPWEDKAYMPQAPKITRIMDNTEKNGNVTLWFNLEIVDADGNQLDQSQLYYKIYLDGEVFTFRKDLYKDLPEDDMTEIPCDFKDYSDFLLNRTVEHTVYLHGVNEFQRVGVQGVYKGGGKVTTTEIVYSDNPSGISTNVPAENGRLISVSYTDLSGRRVSQPVNGIFIKTATYSDGSKKTSKVVMK